MGRNKSTITIIRSIVMCLILAFTSIILPQSVIAANVEIVCNEGDSSCVVTPSDFAPVFDPNNFPENDIKPGDKITRSLKVTNNRAETCSFTIYNFVVNDDTQAATNELFSQVLKTKFSGGGMTTGEISFADLFNTTPLYLGDINPGQTINFDWIVRLDSSVGNEFQQAILDFDFDWTFTCNDTDETVLNLSKSNDTGGSTLSAGDDVVYTIIVWTSDNSVDGVEVVDLPPDGFEYRNGTWTAQSNLRGDLKDLGITTEPTYASPGKWQLGDMQPNETVTLTYVADIQSHVDPGIYPDLVWTRGKYNGSVVMGNDSYVPQYFAGTEVKIDTNQVSGITFGSQVLGASTQLPDTGANTWITLGAIALVFVGFVSMILGIRQTRNINKI